MLVGDRIKEIRKEKHLTQKELGEKLGVSYQMIAQYENGKRNPKPETLKKIADALEVPVSSLGFYDMMVDSFLKQENPLAMDIFNLFAGQPINIAQRGLDVLEPLKESLAESAELAVIQGKDLLDSISRLNEEGQQKVKEYADDLAENPKYQRADAPAPEE